MEVITETHMVCPRCLCKLDKNLLSGNYFCINEKRCDRFGLITLFAIQVQVTGNAHPEVGEIITGTKDMESKRIF